MGSYDPHIAITFGLLLAVCLLVGLITERLGLPKVTAYLLVGLTAGPSVLDWIPSGHLHWLETVTKLAMSLVLFNLGCHFPLQHVRRVLRRSIPLSLGELGMTFLLVAAGLLLFHQSWETALLLAALALATAPATTILVLKESSSQGPVTEHASTLVAMNNFASILVFELIFIGIQLGADKLESPLHQEIAYFARDILGSLLVGAIAGLAISYGCGLLKQGHWLVVLIATATVVLGCCELLGMPYMLAFLAMGVTVVNTSEASEKIGGELDRLVGLLCVVFFVTHGAELDIQAFLAGGVVGAVYIVSRSVGKCAGIAVAARVMDESPQVRFWLGPTLLAQAGAAIALSSIAVERDAALGRPIQAVILGSVVFFEIIGPILIRQSVLRAGEVPLAQAIHHTTATPISQFGAIWNRLLIAFGYEPSNGRPTKEIFVRDLMRKSVEGISESANFDEVIHFIEHSHDNTYPVVDRANCVVGQICYSRLSSALFEPSVGPLVCAADLATSVSTLLHPDDPASRALERFGAETDDCIPVVARELPQQLLGVVRRSDVTNMLIRGRRKS